ncbi:hypothetical protein IV82_GL001229 [Pediococcus acidilactici]|nr:hypothetical protein IV82_GL001229 [Pediococcus acidilactici]
MSNQDVIAAVRALHVDVDCVAHFASTCDGRSAFPYFIEAWRWQFFRLRKHCSGAIRTLLVAIGLVSVELVAFEDANPASIYRPSSIGLNCRVTNQDVIATVRPLHVDINDVADFASTCDGGCAFAYFIEAWRWQFFWLRKHCSGAIGTLLVTPSLVSIELVALEEVYSSGIYRPSSIGLNCCMTNQDVIAAVGALHVDINRVAHFASTCDGRSAFAYFIEAWRWNLFLFREYRSCTIWTLLVALGLVSVELVTFVDVNSSSGYRPSSICSNCCVANQDVIAAVRALHVNINCVASFASACDSGCAFPHVIKRWCWDFFWLRKYCLISLFTVHSVTALDGINDCTFG